jgi:diacylglycerol kinase family enzyme
MSSPPRLNPGSTPRRTCLQSWLARVSLALAFLAVAVVLVFAGRKSLAMLGVGLAASAVSLAAVFLVLSRRGLLRWLSLALLVLAPVTVIVVYAFASLLWVALVSAACWLLAGLTARAALTQDRLDWRMPELPALPPARHPFLIMNPRSGGGKVAQFGLVRKAEALGAEVFLMTGPEPVDVAEVARKAVTDGADLLGVAGGDGTQALVAGVAAERGIPFVVITAGTRNHFALDLGLDRADPAACLGALSDGVDLQVDLGVIGGQTFVNNASFGAYAEVVQSAAYRDDKLGTTLDMLPELLNGHRGARLSARADGVTIEAPQALLVACNPYGMGDIAGLGRRARLDRGVLGVVAITVATARQAVGLLRGRHAAGVRVLTARTIAVNASAERIPVGIDGEAVSMPVPVQCEIRPRVLRVRVPRDRPGVPAPKPAISWSRLRHLASWHRERDADAPRLHAGHRSSRRGGVRQGAGGADDDYRHRAARRLVGHEPGGA